MKIEEIKTIVKLMSDHDLTEFKIEAEAYNLCIRRGCGTPVVAAVAAPVAAPVKTIDAPLVGTFYRAASPEAESFVKVGDTVAEDSVIGIIEAMKVMNEIKAEKSGVIKEILVENGQPVEYGQPLLVIE